MQGSSSSARITQWVIGFVVAGATAGVLIAQQQQSPLTEPQAVGAGIARMSDDPTTVTGGGAATNMTYHNGPVQHTQKIFTIFWNPTATPFPSGYQTTINQFVQDLNGAPYYAIASQYGDSTGNISPNLSYGGTWLDATNAYPESGLTYSDLLAEVNRAKTANGWTSDANSYFQVYTGTGAGTSLGSNYCGLHWFANPAIGQILLPQAGCFMSSPYPNNQTVDAAINTSAHEIMETVTDPQGSAWYYLNSSGEIGDLCNFNFGTRAGDGSDVTLSGHPYVIQQEWSNATSACVMSANAAPAITSNPSNATATSGTNALFTVAASGIPTPTYQWQVSTNGGTTFSNLTEGVPYTNVTTTPLTVAATATVSGYQLRCVASNAAGSATSTAATLTVTLAPFGGGLVHLNGDSRTDVFLYNASAGNWYRENTAAAGGFTEGAGAWASGWSISSANFNGDALTDMFVFSTTTGQWYKELNDGAGGFTTQASGVWSPTWQRYVMDLDGDGIDDVFLYDPASGSWYKCISTPTGFTYIAGAWTTGWEIYPMNLNGDALGDLFLFSRTSGQWYWAVGTAGGFTYPQSSYWATDWKLYPGDYNGDGKADLLLHRPSTGEYYVALTGASGFSYIHGGWITGWTPWVMDLDGNGTSDLFLYNKTTGTWVELLGNGLGTFSQVGGGYWASGWDLYPTDFNGDGRADWLLYNPTNGQYYQAWNTSNGAFTYYGGTWLSGLSVITGPPIR